MKLVRFQGPQEPTSGSRPVWERSGTGPYSMSVFIIFFLCLSATAGEDSTSITTSSDQSELLCHDWGRTVEAELVINGEAGWLFCPLFSHPTLYDYSSAHSSGLSLFWYHLPPEQDLERPIEYSQRVSKDREILWFQPANEYDTGQYICTLRNRTSCTKIAMSLEVVSSGTDCPHLVAMVPRQVYIPVQMGKVLSCPGLQKATKMADSAPSVTWYHNCSRYPFWDSHRDVKGDDLIVHQMGKMYQGLYYCRVRYVRKNLTLTFTRALNVSAVSPGLDSKVPFILIPNDHNFTVRLGAKAQLLCRATFPFLENSPRAIWWTVDGKTVASLTHTRFSETNQRVELEDYGDQTVVRELVVTEVQREDLRSEFNCSVRSAGGTATKRAQLQQEPYSPSVELGCGLGGTLMLMLVLFLVYHVFWLELLLLYRAWFGTDERCTDEKEFDVYISYVRDGEEEQFAVSTLRDVLENQLGYSVCIFDRDSLPGGTITDETLSFVGRSRRLLVVLSPGFASRGTQALLELKAGLDHMALGGHLRVILVQYRPLKGRAWVGELRRARVALALLRWKGDESKELTSRFWKRLRLELPLQQGRDSERGARTYQSQSSTSSQTGLLSPGPLAVHGAQYSGGKL